MENKYISDFLLLLTGEKKYNINIEIDKIDIKMLFMSGAIIPIKGIIAYGIEI